jgi:hypothetical protein
MGTSRWAAVGSGAATFLAMLILITGGHGSGRWLAAVIGLAGIAVAVLALLGVGIKRP